MRTSHLLASVLLPMILAAGATAGQGEALRIESHERTVEVDPKTALWSLADRRSGVRWPTAGYAAVDGTREFAGGFKPAEVRDTVLRLQSTGDGAAIVFELVDAGRTLEIRYETKSEDEICVGDGLLEVTDKDGGYALVPCREGLLIPADSGKSFQRSFGTSDYEGMHMNMLGLVKSGSCLVVTWDDAYVWVDLRARLPEGKPFRQILTSSLRLRRTARRVQFTPLGKGDFNTVAAGYRRMAEGRQLAVTLADKIARQPHAKLMVGASNAKLWTCLARRRNEQSTEDESVKVRWTFDEAARIAEHLRNDLQIDRCLFMMGGWTEGGYDCRHPDNLPANPECGGNEKLADAVRRIQRLGYVASLHDNYQDLYRDAASWNPDYIEKDAQGNLITGGRWLGGRAYMVAAPYQLKLARREQNLPSIKRLFNPWSYFIDTTYAVGPRESADPKCPVDRNTDVEWKIKLSDYARDTFGLFGSECGREWALPHSDFFEGNVGVSGRYYHNLKPEELGATVIPLFEMVYHDCQICYGKYGYAGDAAAEYVAHHVLCARPLHYHRIPDHLYWQQEPTQEDAAAAGPQINPPGAPPGAAPARGAFVRCDRGWAEGMHPTDVFIKNTHEVLGPLHAATAFQRLTELEFLSEDGKLRRATYGRGGKAVRATVNFGTSDAAVETDLGGQVMLSPLGFVVEGPSLVAFYANKWGGQTYANGALFTIRPVQAESFAAAEKVKIFHGFGDPTIVWQGGTHTVRREQTVDAK